MTGHERAMQAEREEQKRRVKDTLFKQAAITRSKVLRYLTSVVDKSVIKLYDKIDVKALWIDEDTSQEHYRVNFWLHGKIFFSTFIKMWGDEGVSDPCLTQMVSK